MTNCEECFFFTNAPFFFTVGRFAFLFASSRRGKRLSSSRFRLTRRVFRGLTGVAASMAEAVDESTVDKQLYKLVKSPQIFFEQQSTTMIAIMMPNIRKMLDQHEFAQKHEMSKLLKRRSNSERNWRVNNVARVHAGTDCVTVFRISTGNFNCGSLKTVSTLGATIFNNCSRIDLHGRRLKDNPLRINETHCRTGRISRHSQTK